MRDCPPAGQHWACLVGGWVEGGWAALSKEMVLWGQ